MPIGRDLKQTLISTTTVSALLALPVAFVVALPDTYVDDEAPIGTSSAINFLEAALTFAGVVLVGVVLFALVPRAIQWLIGRLVSRPKGR